MFDTIIMVDWSGGNDTGPRPRQDAIWTCQNGHDPIYHRNRKVAEDYLIKAIDEERQAGRRLLVGFDLCFAYPSGFARVLTGSDDPLAVWNWFEAAVEDNAKSNNRFDVAAKINRLFPGVGPFWYNGLKRDIEDLPRTKSGYGEHGLPSHRETDGGAFSPWQLGGVGAVGGQVIMGLPLLARLRRRFAGDVAVWPFEKTEMPIVLSETYFSQMPDALARMDDEIKDAAQVRLYAETFAALDDRQWETLLDVEETDEGWVLGRGHEDMLEAIALAPPVLKNDCFAMPRGAYWTPVDDALAHLRANLVPVTGIETVDVAQAGGRILATQIKAQRSHPPHPNSAVDGYAFLGPAPSGAQRLPLVAGRAAAGVPFAGTVQRGEAIRILTGASLPDGVDTVVLQEDVTATESHIAFHGPLKAGANARRAGEDMTEGATILSAKRVLTAADLATLTAAGVAQVAVRAPLRVGVLSTGDELRDAHETATTAQIYDANRPMLLEMLRRWNFAPVDLQRCPDDRVMLRQRLSEAAQKCDVILTSGGASGGDEDHMSALLQDTGSFALWRMALKPGRPLALGLWESRPVFALPGNPVAAFVCALIFARPTLMQMAGADWIEPQGFDVPAGFAKSKKAGRREYLRARLENGIAVPFASEGSGRVSGLSWADGLIELPDEAMTIARGDDVRFLPFASFGL